MTTLELKKQYMQLEILSFNKEFNSTIQQIRYSYALYEKYECKPGLTITCPVQTFGGKDDQKILQDELKKWEEVISMSANID